MIETSAGPVYSLLVEEVLIADCSDIVADCAVVGVPAGSGKGDVPVAVVRLRDGVKEPSPEALLDQANRALAAARLAPLGEVLVARGDGDYPTGVTGKVLKRDLRLLLAMRLGLRDGARGAKVRSDGASANGHLELAVDS